MISMRTWQIIVAQLILGQKKRHTFENYLLRGRNTLLRCVVCKLGGSFAKIYTITLSKHLSDPGDKGRLEKIKKWKFTNLRKRKTFHYLKYQFENRMSRGDSWISHNIAISILQSNYQTTETRVQRSIHGIGAEMHLGVIKAICNPSIRWLIQGVIPRSRSIFWNKLL